MEAQAQESEQPVPGGEETEPALPAPEGGPAAQWAERAEKAQEARALGLKLRKGKRLVFSSRHHLTG
jgi:hypothetical protein